MSMFPKKYHGPELKCGGHSMCSDCRERIKKDIPMPGTLNKPKKGGWERFRKRIKKLSE